ARPVHLQRAGGGRMGGARGRLRPRLRRHAPPPGRLTMAARADLKRADLARRFPTIADLRRRARRRVPRFAFDFVDGGANDEESIARNMRALSAVELLPRYCVDTTDPSLEVELFGRRYAAP